ncbi:MAG TPA: hypothetical protein VKB45_17530 [Gemmatimonadales bacterium]|nr:hypothetical protein [Gemmatimonadales bacterium]
MLVLLIIGGTICCVTYFATRHPKDGSGGREAAALQQEVDGLHVELDGVRQELSELAERLDFAERMLAKQREGERLSPPKG